VGCLKDNVQIAEGPDYCPLSTSLYLRVRCLLVKQEIAMIFVSLYRGFSCINKPLSLRPLNLKSEEAALQSNEQDIRFCVWIVFLCSKRRAS
jgi:hypothetical protein